MNLFTYGTLTYPEVIEALTGRVIKSRECSLNGYSRVCLKGLPYPSVRKAEWDIEAAPRPSVRGRLYFSISSDELEAIDLYEGELYERRSISLDNLSPPRLTTVMS